MSPNAVVCSASEMPAARYAERCAASATPTAGDRGDEPGDRAEQPDQRREFASTPRYESRRVSAGKHQRGGVVAPPTAAPLVRGARA